MEMFTKTRPEDETFSTDFPLILKVKIVRLLCIIWCIQNIVWPLENLSYDEKGEGDGQGHPEVSWLGVGETVSILQIGPAETFWKP